MLILYQKTPILFIEIKKVTTDSPISFTFGHVTCHVTIIKEAQEVPPNTPLTQALKNPLRFISLSVVLPSP